MCNQLIATSNNLFNIFFFTPYWQFPIYTKRIEN